MPFSATQKNARQNQNRQNRNQHQRQEQGNLSPRNALGDHYGVLGVSYRASQNEIRKAYKKLALKHHPDKNIGDEDAAEKFRKVQQAYEELGDEDKRRRYDQTRRRGF